MEVLSKKNKKSMEISWLITDIEIFAHILFMGTAKSKGILGIVLLKGNWWVLPLVTIA